MYVPVYTEGFEPTERRERFQWLSGVSMPFSTAKFTWMHGNYLGNITVLWKVPERQDERDGQQDSQVMSRIRESMPNYATRQMRKDFMEHYTSCS